MSKRNDNLLSECIKLLKDINRWDIASTTIVKGNPPKLVYTIPKDLRARIEKLIGDL